ncbi:hypothetical protein CMK18_22605 [Candidatus Poribacteria bacterium]|nr:hypothetical protein [Candidatus Poribacteria bacterium]
MTVSLTVSDVFPVVLGTSIANSIAGGGGSQVGWNIGSVTSGQWGPITNKISNLGHKDLYLAHDGTNKITNFTIHIAEFGTTTGYTYGGSSTAALDYAGVKAQGSASGTSKNNLDNASAGLWIEYEHVVSDANRFDYASRPSLVNIFGKSNLGISDATGFDLKSESMIYNSSGATVANSPVDGEIGAAADSVLGDTSHIQLRHYMEANPSLSSTVQYEMVYRYSFTS